MPQPVVPRDFAFQPGVYREQDPFPNRIVLWVRGARVGDVQPWERIANNLPVAITEINGVSATAATVTPFRQSDGKIMSKLFAFVGKKKEGPTPASFYLPTGESAVPAGTARRDALLVWLSESDASLAEQRITALWPNAEKHRQLGDRLFLVVGAEIPKQVAAAAPAPSLSSDLATTVTAPVFSTPPPPAVSSPLLQPIAPPPNSPAAARVAPSVAAAPTMPNPVSSTTNGPPAPSPATPSARPAQTQFRARYNQLVQQVAHFHRQGNYQQAIEVAAQARELTFQHVGEEQPEYATILNNMAEAHRALGHYADAEPLYQQALTIWRKALGDDHQQVVTCLDNLGQLFQADRKYANAAKFYQQAFDIWQKKHGQQNPFLAVLSNSLAEVARDGGDYARSRDLYEKALEIRRAAVGENHAEYAQAMFNLAEAERLLGKHQDADTHYKQSLTIRKALRGDDHPDVAVVRGRLADLERLRANYVAAEPLFRQAVSVLQSAKAREYQLPLAKALTGQGDLHRALREWEKAEPLLRQALAIRQTTLGEKHPDVAVGFHHLADLCLAAGNLTAAEPFLKQASLIVKDSVGEEHPLYADTLQRMGTWSLAKGQHADAEVQLQKAHAIRHARLGDEHPEMADSIAALGVLYGEMGRFADAEEHLQRSLDARRRVFGDDHPGVGRLLLHLGAMKAAQGQYPEALDFFRQAAAVDDRLNSQVFRLGTDERVVTFLERHHNNLDPLLSLVTQNMADVPAAIEAALDLVCWRKLLLGEARAARREAVLAERYPEHTAALRELADLRRKIATRCLAGPGSEGGEAHGQILADWRARKGQLEAELMLRMSEMSLVEALRAVERRTVLGGLPDGANGIEYARTRIGDFKAVPAKGEARWRAARYFAFTRSGDGTGTVQIVDLGEAEKIDKAAAELRACLVP